MGRLTSLPVVHVGSLFETSIEADLSGISRKHAAEKLLAAFETEGMAYLRFDGASRTEFRTIMGPSFEEAKRFFSRSPHEKESATVNGLQPGVTRGYLGTGTESGASQLEWKEAFSWSYDWEGRNANPQNSLEANNIWPAAPEGISNSVDESMKSCFNQLFAFMGKVMAILVGAILEAWPAHYGPVPDLRTLSKKGDTISLLRSFHYYAATNATTEMTGSNEHTDWGFATLIAQQEDGGTALQVQLNGKWTDVPPMADTLVVNCSDFLSLLTDGRLRSPLHRVVLTENDRISFVYFHYPGFETPVPRISDLGKERTKGLFLLKNQSDDTVRDENEVTATAQLEDLTFGELIALKWQQVSRTSS